MPAKHTKDAKVGRLLDCRFPPTVELDEARRGGVATLIGRALPWTVALLVISTLLTWVLGWIIFATMFGSAMMGMR